MKKGQLALNDGRQTKSEHTKKCAGTNWKRIEARKCNSVCSEIRVFSQLK